MQKTHTFPSGTKVTYDDDQYCVRKGAVCEKPSSGDFRLQDVKRLDWTSNVSGVYLYAHAFEIDGTVYCNRYAGYGTAGIGGIRVEGPHIKDYIVDWTFLQGLWRNSLLLDTVTSEHNRKVYFQNIWDAVCKIRRCPRPEGESYPYWDVPLLTFDVYKDIDPSFAMIPLMGYYYGHQYSSVVFVPSMNDRHEIFWDYGRQKRFPFHHLTVDTMNFFVCDEQDAYLLKLRDNFRVFEVGKYSRLRHRADENNLTLADAAVD